MLTPDETLLGLLKAAPRHGYLLLEAFNDPARLGRVWRLSTSQLYAVLKRLETRGEITGQQATSENAPPRTEYELTPAGAARLHLWLNEAAPSASIRRVRVEFFSRLYIAHLLALPTAPLIAHQRAACLHERGEWCARLAAETEAAGQHFGTLAAELVIAQLDAVLGWLDRCETVFPLRNPQELHRL